MPGCPSRNEAVALEPDSSTPFPAQARSGKCVLVGPQKHPRGRIVNGWLILIGIVGAIVVVADGLTRPLYSDLEPWPQSLQYDPYSAAFLLAGITLPLAFAYARRARVPLTEALFLWFILCTTAYNKDFSYLRLPGVPLFVTDIVLIVLLTSIYIVQRRRGPRLPAVLNISLALFVLAGVLAAARGFLGHHESLLVLRDSAIVGYSLFLLVGYHVTKDWLVIRRVAVWFALGAALSILNGLAQFADVPEQRRFVSAIYVLVPLVGVLVMTANGLIGQRLAWILAGVFSIGLFLANSRSAFVIIVVLSVLALLVPGLFRRKRRLVTLITGLVTGAVLAGSFTLVYLHLRSERAFAVRVAGELSSGFLHTSNDPRWQFRLMAWKEAWNRFKEYPAAGEGFGIPFIFEIWDSDVRPHNTFLTVLYKMGLVGFLPLLVFLAYFFLFGFRAIRRNLQDYHVVFLEIVILALVCFCGWGGASLMLESPYLASLFWVGIGASLRMIHKLDSERSTRNALRERYAIGSNKLRLRAIPAGKAIL
jgi:O-antigen ligase